jgi:outer membrane protein TolC
MTGPRISKRTSWIKRLGLSLFLLSGLTISASPAQEPAQEPPQEHEVPFANRPLSLTDCLSIGMSSQPAMGAANSSLAAALAAQSGVDNLPRFAGLLSRDLRVRRHQAAWGVQIASAGVDLAEWETRYAIIRNFYSVMYAHTQGKLLDELVEKLKAARDKTAAFLEDPKIKVKDLMVSDLDVKNLEAQIGIYRARRAEASVGMKKALAALREAMGVQECPLILIEAPLLVPIPDLECRHVLALAMERRGEMVQVNSALQVTGLEIEAQRLLMFKMTAKTFASASDIHSKPIPQGIFNNEYRPGAIGLEMPVFMVGRRGDRVDRAEAFHSRAGSVVDKTANLVTLDAEVAFYKWEEAVERIRHLEQARKVSYEYAESATKRFMEANGKRAPDELVRSRTLQEQTQAAYNEALYIHVLALAGLERVTAGGIPFMLPAAQHP